MFLSFQELTACLHSHLTRDSETNLVFRGIDVDKVLIQRAKELHKDIDDHVTFEHLDIMEEKAEKRLKDFLSVHDRSEFDLITCFSVSMWIHLNHGDVGLNNFVKKLSTVTKYLLLEPQPWKCYRTAARRMRKLGQPEFEHLGSLKVSGQEELDMFLMGICSDCGFQVVKEFGETNWKRRLVLFKKA